MRFYHNASDKRIHQVGANFSIPFVATDFIVNTKHLMPTQTYIEPTNDPKIISFKCLECGIPIEIVNLTTKCFKCGDFLPIDIINFHSKTGLVFCKEHSIQYKEEKETIRSLFDILDKSIEKETVNK